MSMSLRNSLDQISEHRLCKVLQWSEAADCCRQISDGHRTPSVKVNTSSLHNNADANECERKATGL